MSHIRWFPHPNNDNVVCGMFSGSDHNLLDCEVEHWVHTVRGDVYEPILMVRSWTEAGRVSAVRRVRIEGPEIPYMIHSLDEAKAVCERYFGTKIGGNDA